MQFDAKLFEYLHGAKFSNGLQAAYPFAEEDFRYDTRINWLRTMCAGKKVVHVGCVDHALKQVKHKLKRGNWLHAHLMEICARVLGVDIDANGIDELRQELQITDLLAADLRNDPCEPIVSAQWDMILLAEVLEHIGDPVSFLSTLRERFGHLTSEFVITVPNVFASEVVSHAKRGIEAINSDHRFWFTPFTIAKVCIDAGLTPTRVVLCRNGTIKRRALLRNRRMRRQPLLRNNIIVCARVSDTHRD